MRGADCGVSPAPEHRLHSARIAGSIRGFCRVLCGTSHADSQSAMPTFNWRYCETCKVLRREIDGRVTDCGHTNSQPVSAADKNEDQSALDVLVSWRRFN